MIEMPHETLVPKLTLRLELGSILAALDEEARLVIRQHVSQRIGLSMSRLGIPGKAIVDLMDLQDPPAREVVRIFVNNVRCGFSHVLMERAQCWVRGVPWQRVERGKLGEWLRSSVTDSHASSSGGQMSAAAFLGVLCEGMLALTPNRLLGPDQVAVLSANLSMLAGAAGENGPFPADQRSDILHRLVAQGISLRNLLSGYARLSEALSVDHTPEQIAEDIVSLCSESSVAIHVSPAYLREITENDDENAREALTSVRDQLYYELGLRFPGLRFVADADLGPRVFAVKINDVIALPWVGIGPDEAVLNLDPTHSLLSSIDRTAVMNPSSINTGCVVPAQTASELQTEGVQSRGALAYLAAAVACELRTRAPSLVHLHAVSYELDRLALSLPQLVRLARSRWSDVTLTRVMRYLLAEEISIRSMSQVLQNLVDFDYVVTDARQLIVFDERVPAPSTPSAYWSSDPVTLAASVRTALKRYISHKYTQGRATLDVYLLDWEIEDQLVSAGTQSLDEEQRDRILGAVHEELDGVAGGESSVILTAIETRQAMRSIIAREFPRVAVVAYQELSPDMMLRQVAKISLD